MTKKKTEYQEQKEIWYKRLKDDGFKDLEHDDGTINIGVPRSMQGQDAELRQLVQDYYCMCYYFLNSHRFENELEKVVWEYHTEGLSVRDISKALKSAEIDMSKDRVWRAVRRLEDIMKGLYLSV